MAQPAADPSRPAVDPVEAFYAAYNAHDAVAAAALYTEDGWHEEAHNGARREGREALKAGLDRFFGFIVDAHWQPRERIDAGPRVAVVYTLTGRLGVDIKGRPTRGLAIELKGAHLFDIADGRLLGTCDYWDPAMFQRQIEAAA
ncbi:nuclear transport factor 2 family protein [Ancylobacter sp. Lp-2]|uniref:nuclear transport factor 2 family protein n=1 Tax=Ancylobacter sp. Lp-2 TaxID=2881339 RepID=UPI001E2E38EE|nr:nuclear transport factor 2 family protein [Ancylobacter sp. Lp-2]MCB4769845.1 nuclear transport factor 2 family protein [Ancylobacter sp. Lp-2]